MGEEKKVSDSDIKLPKRTVVYLPELFEIVSKCKTVKARERLFREYCALGPIYEESLKIVGRGLFHPGVEFLIPEGAPPYKENDKPYDQCSVTLFKALRNIGRYCKCPDQIDNRVKRESFFIGQLENLHKDEAKLLIMIKDREIDKKVYKGVTETLFRNVFPDILPPKEK